jgi:ribosomal protein S18 acetylase RimI-like enzyme
MTKVLDIQTAQPQDFQSIAALNIAAYSEFADSLTDEAWARMRLSLNAIDKVAQRAEFLIVSIDRKLVGSVAYCPPGNSIDPIPTDWASILLLAVAPNHRGCGIARQLIEACFDRARADKAQKIGLFTSALMTNAIQLYQSYHFHQESEIPSRLGVRYWRYRLDLTE